MAGSNIDRAPSRRTGPLCVIEGDGVPRQPLDLANLTVLQLRTLLGEEYGPRLSDKDAEDFVKLVRRMADKQATVPSPEDLLRQLLDEQAAALSLSTEELVSRMRDEPGVALGLSPEELVRRLADEQAAASDAQARFTTQEDYKPKPPNQMRGQPGRKSWHTPAAGLSTTIDRMLRRADDSKLLPFSRKSPLTEAIYTILSDLGFTLTQEALSAYIVRWRKKWGLPLGATDGRQLLREKMLHQAKLLKEEQLRHGRERLNKEGDGTAGV
jgi:hypothetical protein